MIQFTRKIKWSAAVSTLAAVVALWVTLDPWPSIGWTTPNQHNADFAMTSEGVKDFRDEWKCDEWEEELLELLQKQADGDHSVQTERDIEKLRIKITKLKCERFED